MSLSPLFNILLRRITLIATLALTAMSHAAEPDQPVPAKAPPRFSVLKHTHGGAYFIPSDLLKQHDALIARVRALQAQVADGNVPGADALRELKELEIELETLRKQVEAQKVLVSPLKLQKQTEEMLFDLAPDHLLVITADNVKVVGWDKPQVKCVLEKSLLATGDQPETEQFKGLHLNHRVGSAPDLVGKTQAEWDAEEKAAGAGKAERNPVRDQLVQQIRRGNEPYRDFQGKQLDVIEIKGLTHDEGNRQITVDIRSEGGGGSMGSDWRRSARLTVYVPQCRGVLLRGCLGSIDVQKLKCPLILTDAGSLDRDYEGTFTISDQQGPVALYNVPLDRLENVHGDVKIVATIEYANTATHHENGEVVTIIPPPRECAVKGIEGNFSAWFARVNLTISGVSGVVDVKNETGNTRFSADGPLANGANRLVSDSGRIEAHLKQGALGKLPIMALTNHGTVRTNASRSVLDQTSFTEASSADGTRRAWMGVKTKTPFDPNSMMDEFSRPGAAIRGEQRSPGLDIISLSGNVVVKVEP